MVDHLSAIGRESGSFAAAIAATPWDAGVPSCPGWTVEDLTWHLTEVQEFWRKIVEDLRTTPEGMERLTRPHANELASAFDKESQLLIQTLRRADPAASCWSWHEGGGNVAWVLRRQAHEALIHRVDAELAGGGVSAIDEELAADGVDEILTVMIDATDLPGWAAFTPDGRTAQLGVGDGSRTWGLELGRFEGTSPASGTTYDEVAVRVIAAPSEPDVTIRGSAADLDLWLWGRGPLERLSVDGEVDVAGAVRTAAIHATQ